MALLSVGDKARVLPWGHPMAYVAKVLRKSILGLLPQLVPAGGGRLLDFGCADSPYRSGPSKVWLKSKNPQCEAVRRESEEDWN